MSFGHAYVVEKVMNAVIGKETDPMEDPWNVSEQWKKIDEQEKCNLKLEMQRNLDKYGEDMAAASCQVHELQKQIEPTKNPKYVAIELKILDAADDPKHKMRQLLNPGWWRTACANTEATMNALGNAMTGNPWAFLGEVTKHFCRIGGAAELGFVVEWAQPLINCLEYYSKKYKGQQQHVSFVFRFVS
jgi:hypothetical protein